MYRGLMMRRRGGGRARARGGGGAEGWEGEEDDKGDPCGRRV